MERDLSVAPIPEEISQLPEARLQTCMRSPSPRGTFRADLPPGEYEAELIFAVRGSGTREGPVKMNVSLQDQRVLTNFDGGSYTEAVLRTFPVHIPPEGHLKLTLEGSEDGHEWGLSALVLRPRK
jgi:hypothetical protein